MAPQFVLNLVQAPRSRTLPQVFVLLGNTRLFASVTAVEESIPTQADAIYRERVLRARKMDPATKMSLGPEMYAEALQRMRDGIRHQFPEAKEEEVRAILRKRLRRLDRLEQHDREQQAQCLPSAAAAQQS